MIGPSVIERNQEKSLCWYQGVHLYLHFVVKDVVALTV